MSFSGTFTSTAGGMYGNPIPKQQYNPDDFKYCEKCGTNVSGGYGYIFDEAVYRCDNCGFKKKLTHVSFGFYRKIPNYVSLTNTHQPSMLYFADGSTIEERIARHDKKYFSSTKKAHEKWQQWADENTIEMVKIVSLQEVHNVGIDLKLKSDDNILIQLKEELDSMKGIYLHFIAVKKGKTSRKAQKIGHAIDRALKKSKTVVWIGGHETIDLPAQVNLRNASARLGKACFEFKGYKEPENYENWEGGFGGVVGFPVYITGPSLYTSSKSQEELDEHVAKLLTHIQNVSDEKDKIKVILNTGNTGVETSVIRWAIKNNIHSVVVNLPTIMFLNADGYNRFDTTSSAVARILGETAIL